jgi:hypothetical protein
VVDLDNPTEKDYETAFKLKPRCIVASGSGLHLYFRLHIRETSGRDYLQARNALAIKKLQKLFEGKVDKACSDPERVLRIPSTVNLKNNKLATIKYQGKQDPTFQRWYDNITPSEIDYSLASTLARKGLDKDSIKSAIQEWRLSHGDQKGKREKYLEKTAKNAIDSCALPQPVRDLQAVSFSDTSLFKEDFQVRWLVEDIIPEASLSFIVGDPKSKKSWFALETALAVALGQPVAGRFKTRKEPVLYLQLEDGLLRVSERFYKLTRSHGARPSNGAFTTYVGSALKFSNESAWQEIKKICDKKQPKLIVVDTLSKSHNYEENNVKEMTQLIDKFCYLRDTYGASVFVVHHLTKAFMSQGGHKVYRKMRGSTVIEAAAESILTVTSDEATGICDVHVVTKSNEEFGFHYKLHDHLINSKPAVRIEA